MKELKEGTVTVTHGTFDKSVFKLQNSAQRVVRDVDGSHYFVVNPESTHIWISVIILKQNKIIGYRVSHNGRISKTGAIGQAFKGSKAIDVLNKWKEFDKKNEKTGGISGFKYGEDVAELKQDGTGLNFTNSNKSIAINIIKTGNNKFNILCHVDEKTGSLEINNTLVKINQFVQDEKKSEDENKGKTTVGISNNESTLTDNERKFLNEMLPPYLVTWARKLVDTKKDKFYDIRSASYWIESAPKSKKNSYGAYVSDMEKPSSIPGVKMPGIISKKEFEDIHVKGTKTNKTLHGNVPESVEEKEMKSKKPVNEALAPMGQVTRAQQPQDLMKEKLLKMAGVRPVQKQESQHSTGKVFYNVHEDRYYNDRKELLVFESNGVYKVDRGTEKYDMNKCQKVSIHYISDIDDYK